MADSQFEAPSRVTAQPNARERLHARILDGAPEMPRGFYGSVTYSYQNGKLNTAKVEQVLKD